MPTQQYDRLFLVMRQYESPFFAKPGWKSKPPSGAINWRHSAPAPSCVNHGALTVAPIAADTGSSAFYFVSTHAHVRIPKKHPALRLRRGRRTSINALRALSLPEFLRCLGLLILLIQSVVSYAHENHDDTPAQSVVTWAPSEPRVTAESPKATVVGILKSGRLWLYADSTDGNEPLSNLGIELDVNGTNYRARTDSGSVYSVTAAWADKPGRYEITFTLHHSNFDDLLAGTLIVPTEYPGAHSQSLDRDYSLPLSIIAVLACMYAMLLLAKHRVKARRQFNVAPGYILQMIVITAVTLSVTAMDKKSQPLSTTSTPVNADNLSLHPDRLPDGSIDVPKPSQRALMIRTMAAHMQTVNRTYILNGRVVQNPATYAVVQAEQTGRLGPPPQGFPPLGSHVRKGQLLACLRPIMTPLELARRDADLRGLERDRFLTKRAYERVKTQMGTTDTSASVMLETNRAQLLAFDQQIRTLTDIPTRKIAVTAPIDGVIGASFVANARVVRPGDDLFRIWDPGVNWVEAINFHPGIESRITSAIAMLDNDHKVDLVYTGHGYLLQNQGVPLQFRIGKADGALLIDQLVKVYVHTNETLQGIRVPHDSVISQADSQPFVWIHTAGERFERRAVTAMPLDDQYNIITTGIGPNQRVVTQGASLLSRVQ